MNKKEGHFFISYKQLDLYFKKGRKHVNYCVIDGKEYLYTQWDQRPMYYKILFWLGFVRVNAWSDTRYLGYGTFSHSGRI